MDEKHSAREAVDVKAGSTGCGAECTFIDWRTGEKEREALARTRLGRLVLTLRRLVERLARR